MVLPVKMFRMIREGPRRIVFSGGRVRQGVHCDTGEVLVSLRPVKAETVAQIVYRLLMGVKQTVGIKPGKMRLKQDTPEIGSLPVLYL